MKALVIPLGLLSIASPIVTQCAAQELLGLEVPQLLPETIEDAVAIPNLPLPAFEVRETTIRQIGGRNVTFHRVKPPADSKQDKNPLANSLTDGQVEDLSSSPQAQELLSNASPSQQKSLFLAATVVDGRASLLRWWKDGQECRAWSNIDFNLLDGVTRFSKGATQYTTLLLVSNVESKALPVGSPFLIPAHIQPGSPQITPVHWDFTSPETYEVVSALHELYQYQSFEIQQAQALRIQRKLEREAYLKARPPVPQNMTVHYWKVQPKRKIGSAR